MWFTTVVVLNAALIGVHRLAKLDWGPVMIEHPSDKVVRDLGDTVTLKCRVLNRQSDIVWCINRFCTLGRIEPSKRTPDGLYKLTDDGRICVRVDEAKGNFDLVIKNFTSADEGEYGCQLLKTRKYGAILSDTALVVLLNRTLEEKPIWPYVRPAGRIRRLRKAPIRIPYLGPLVFAITVLQLYLTLALLGLLLMDRRKKHIYEGPKYSLVVV